jgi:hypothetical protein
VIGLSTIVFVPFYMDEGSWSPTGVPNVQLLVIMLCAKIGGDISTVSFCRSFLFIILLVLALFSSSSP